MRLGFDLVDREDVSFLFVLVGADYGLVYLSPTSMQASASFLLFLFDCDVYIFILIKGLSNDAASSLRVLSFFSFLDR